MPAEPRRFRNPEMPAQARVEKPTKAEKRVSARAHPVSFLHGKPLENDA